MRDACSPDCFDANALLETLAINKLCEVSNTSRKQTAVWLLVVIKLWI